MLELSDVLVSLGVLFGAIALCVYVIADLIQLIKEDL